MNIIKTFFTDLYKHCTVTDTTTENSIQNNYLSSISNRGHYSDCSLQDRNISTELDAASTKITDLPDELLDLIFSKLEIKDICNISEACTHFHFISQNRRNTFHIAYNLFSEYSSISQQKIKLIFNKDNYNKRLKPWISSFCNTKHILDYLDNLQNHNTFYKILFFHITKILHQTNALSYTTKFDSSYNHLNDLAVSVGYSSDGNNLFVACISGEISIFLLDENKNFKIQNEFNLQPTIVDANFISNGKTIIVRDADDKITIITLNQENNWEIQQINNLTNLKASNLTFTKDSNHIIATNRNHAYFLKFSKSSDHWEYNNTMRYAFTITHSTVSPDNKYCCIATMDGSISIVLLDSIKLDSSIYLKDHNFSYITSVRFSPDGEYLATTAINNTTNLYRINTKDERICKKRLFTGDSVRYNIHPFSCFSTDGSTVLINHGRTISILSNLNSTKKTIETTCKLESDFNQACISNNSNYIAIYNLVDNNIRLYGKNSQKKWINIANIDTGIIVKFVRFSNNGHHFSVISSEKTLIYNLCSCKKIAHSYADHISSQESKSNILIKDLQCFTIKTPKYSQKHVIFNPYFCQLLVAYDDTIKIFMPDDNDKWSNKLTLKIEEHNIEKIQYTNDGSSILLHSNSTVVNEDEKSDVKLLAIN